jgi:hypothetical protein
MLKYKYQLYPLIYIVVDLTSPEIKSSTHSLIWPHARILPAGIAIFTQTPDLNLLELK